MSLGIAAVLALAGCASDMRAGRTDSTTAGIVELGADAPPFRAAFDASHGKLKLVALVSPT